MADRPSRVFSLSLRLPLLLWQGLFLLAPLGFTVAMSFFLVKNYRMVETFEFTSWEKMLSRSFVWDSYWYTLGMATASTVAISLIAFPAAYALAFMAKPGFRRWAIFLLIVPFFTSYIVRTFSWYVILAEGGPINAILGTLGLGPFTMLNTWFGTMVGYATLSLPLVVIIQTISLANIDPRLVQAAANLGCPPGRAVWRVILPAARTGLMVAALFAFLLSFGDFVAPYYLGGSSPPTLPILIIDTTKSGQQWPRAAVVAVIMIVTLAVIAFTTLALAYRRAR